MMIAVLFEEGHTCRHAQTHTHAGTKEKSSIKQEYHHENLMHLIHFVVVAYVHRDMLEHSHPGLISHFHHHSGGPALWHHGECIGHLTHAPHVSEYISNTSISSQPLKHHVPHRAVWVGGLNIYQWISSLKCHLAHAVFYVQMSVFYFDDYVCSPWLLSVKRQQW